MPPFSRSDDDWFLGIRSRWLFLFDPSLLGIRSADLFLEEEFIISRNDRSCATGAVLRGAELSCSSGSLRGATGATGIAGTGLVDFSLGFLSSLSLSRIDLERPRRPKGFDFGFFIEDWGDTPSGSAKDETERSVPDGVEEIG